MRNYLSFGGGVNSVALHLLLLDQGVEFESVFVHHGTDWPETYQYVAGFQWWLKANGHKPITVLRPKVEGYSVLYDYYYHHRTIPIRQYRICTDKFKVRCLLKYFKGPAFSMIGIDAGEPHRANIGVYTGGFERRYPLVENDIDRNGCIEIIKKHGLPVPMKSGCYICPFQRKSQWIELRRKHPCLFYKAVDMENKAIERRTANGHKPIYISRMPLLALVDEKQMNLIADDDYPPCQCGL